MQLATKWKCTIIIVEVKKNQNKNIHCRPIVALRRRRITRKTSISMQWGAIFNNIIINNIVIKLYEILTNISLFRWNKHVEKRNQTCWEKLDKLILISLSSFLLRRKKFIQFIQLKDFILYQLKQCSINLTKYFGNWHRFNEAEKR